MSSVCLKGRQRPRHCSTSVRGFAFSGLEALSEALGRIQRGKTWGNDSRYSGVVSLSVRRSSLAPVGRGTLPASGAPSRPRGTKYRFCKHAANDFGRQLPINAISTSSGMGRRRSPAMHRRGKGQTHTFVARWDMPQAAYGEVFPLRRGEGWPQGLQRTNKCDPMD